MLPFYLDQGRGRRAEAAQRRPVRAGGALGRPGGTKGGALGRAAATSKAAGDGPKWATAY